MNIPHLRYYTVGLAMFCAASLSVAVTPSQKAAPASTQINLERMIPKQFGDWRIDPTFVPIEVSPDVRDKLNTFYNETLSRTYINSQGRRVMLVIAYGNTQSDALRVHRPEACYSAQGFQITEQAEAYLQTSAQTIPVKQLVAIQGLRIEPITYWMKIGNTVVTNRTDQKWVQLRYGLAGKIADGLLLRISNISGDFKSSYRLHSDFAADLLQAIDEQDISTLIGKGQA